MAKTFQLGRPELAAEVESRLAKGGSRREMERLMALRLGRARSRIIEWMRVAREHGVEDLLGRHQGRGRVPRVKGAVLKGLRHGLRRGRWKRAKEAGQWLEQRHGVKLSQAGVRYWLKKAGES